MSMEPEKKDVAQPETNFGADLEPFLILMESMCKRGAGVKQMIRLDPADIEMWSRLKPFLIRLPALLQTLEAKLKEANNIPLTKLDWYIGAAMISGETSLPIAITRAFEIMDNIPSFIEVHERRKAQAQKEQDNESQNDKTKSEQ